MININTYPNAWDLKYFQEVAHTQNLSRAAERLGVGQPALSLAVKRLEDSLEVRLFVRRNRGLVLTSAGQRLLRESNKILSAWESVVSETKKSQTELVGRFTLGCHPSVAIYALKDVLRKLYEASSGIEIQLTHGLSRIITEGVISGNIDFGVVVNPVRHPDLVIHSLASDEVCFWKTSKSLSHTLIYNPELTQSQALIKKIKKHKGFERSIASDNLEVIATLAEAGTGIAILPSRVVKAVAPGLKRIEGFPHYVDQVTFIYRSDLPKTASAKHIIDLMKNLEI